MNSSRIFRLGLLVVLAIACSLHGRAADRVALVIGNSVYDRTRKIDQRPNLPNPRNDAEAIAQLFRRLGFEVISRSDANREAMFEALADFKGKAANARLGVLYYAGHGIEDEGANYLLPVDAVLEKKSQLDTQTVPLRTVLEKLRETRLPAKMLILDCCRDDPFTRSWRFSRGTGGRGLGEVSDSSLPDATMIMFAAAPGQPALDGESGHNSPFNEALREHLPRPGVSAFDAFMAVSDTVANLTNDKQVPWIKFDGAGRDFRRFNLATGSVVDRTKLAKSETPKPVVPSIPAATPQSDQVVETSKLAKLETPKPVVPSIPEAYLLSPASPAATTNGLGTSGTGPSDSSARSVRAKTFLMRAMKDALSIRSDLNPPKLLAIVRELAASGDIEESVKAMAGVPVPSDPTWGWQAIDYAQGWQSIAKAQAKAGDLDAARKTVAMIKVPSSKATALTGIALLQASAGNRDGFHQFLADARSAVGSLDPLEKAGALIEIAEAQIKQGEVEEARRTLAEANGKAFSQLHVTGTEADTKWQLLTRIGETQAKIGDTAASRQTFLDSKRLALTFRFDKDMDLAWTARHQARWGDLASAKSIAESLKGENKDYALAEIAMGLAEAGDLAGARKTADAIKVESSRSEPLVFLTKTQAASGDLAGAKKMVNSFADVRAKTDALQEIGTVQFKAGDFTGGRETFSEALNTAMLLAGDVRNGALDTLAKTQAEAGDVSGAKTTAGPSPSHYTLLEIIKAQAKAGEVDGAEELVKAMEPGEKRCEGYLALAEGMLGDFTR